VSFGKSFYLVKVVHESKNFYLFISIIFLSMQLKNAMAALWLLTLLAACNNDKTEQTDTLQKETQEKGFKISGRINGMKGSQNIYISYQQSADPADVNSFHRDSVIAKDGVFVFEGKLPSPQIVSLTSENNNVVKVMGMFIGNEDVTVEADLATMEMKNLPTVKGSPIHEEFKKVDELGKFLEQNPTEMMEKFKATSAAFERNDKTAIAQYCRENTRQREADTEQRITYARSHPDSYISAFLLDRMVYSLNHFPVDEYEEAYKSLAEPVQKSVYGQTVAQAIRQERQAPGRIGALVPDTLGFTTIDGRKMRLSDLKGKYVLLDYWFSACIECQCGKDQIAEAYSRFKSKGFEVIGIASDENMAALRKAMTAQQRNWTQTIGKTGAFGGLQGSIISFPTRILLDGKGKVVARYDDVSIENLNADLAKLMRQ
jgi:peroxiredoxin